MVEQIKALCEINGTTIKALERQLDLGNGTIRRWDISSPSVEKLAKVADYFNVTIDSLRDETDKKEKLPAQMSEELTPEQIEMLKIMKEMTPEQRAQWYAFGAFLRDKK